MRTVGIILLAMTLSGCALFGGKKTQLAPQAYMPTPPAILMEAPKELKTIKKQKTNLTVTETSVIVEAKKE